MSGRTRMNLQHYDDLSWRKLVYDDRWLIVIIEILDYYESFHKEYIRFNHLKVRCNQAIWTLGNKLGKHEISIPDGTFALIIHSGKYEKFFTVKQVKVKSKKGTWVTQTRIYPHIPEIQEEIKSKKIENLAGGEVSLSQINRKRGDKVDRVETIIEPSVEASDFLARQTSKTRAPPTESLKVSGWVTAVVTHDNQGKQKKKVPNDLIELC
jgi:hypothetical protein